MSILTSKYPSLEIPEDVSFSQLILEEAVKCPDELAVIDDASGEQITYGSLKNKIEALAHAFHERGLRKGEVVCLHAPKSIPGIIAAYAILQVGAVMTPSRPSHKQRELERQLIDSEAKYIVSDANLMQTTVAAVKNAPTVQRVYTIGNYDGYESVDDLILHAGDKRIPTDGVINPKEDIAVIIYSSGTTGLPKGVKLTHYALVGGTKLFQSSNLNHGDVFFQNASHFHIGGINLTSNYLSMRKIMVLITPKTVTELLQKAKEYKVKSMLGLPAFFTNLSILPDEDIKEIGLDFSEITFFASGAKLNATNTKELLLKTGVKSVVQLFANTEMAGTITYDSPTNFVPGSAGIVAPNTQIKIIEVKTGEILGPHQLGEICVKGPTMMKGYLNNDEATRNTIDTDGWLHTGDLGHYDETEHLFVTDRMKHVFKIGSTPVFPSEIEEVIYTHPAVKSVCVVGVEDDKAGEVPLACVIVKDGHSVTEQEIVKLVEDNLADYKRLRGGVKFMKQFPMSSMGKIVRHELKKMI